MLFSHLGRLIAQHWLLVILAWTTLAVCTRVLAPRWEDITQDGDLAYLPNHCSSIIGEKLLQQAFPRDRSNSQAVIIVARRGGRLRGEDIYTANDLARRFRNIEGVVKYKEASRLAQRAQQATREGNNARAAELTAESQAAMQIARAALEEAVRLDEEFVEFRRSTATLTVDRSANTTPRRWAAPYHNLAQILAELRVDDEADYYRQLSRQYDPTLSDKEGQFLPAHAATWPIIDVWTWHDELIGRKLISDDEHARLIILHLSNEFLSTDNIRVLGLIEEQLERVREQLTPAAADLTLGISGSAAVGGDMLRAARDSIRNTEMFTVILVVLVLVAVYRSPLLVAVPLITIGVSLLVAVGTTSLLTQLNSVPGLGWWDLKVFTTTKIFIVVILFGSGTDFCLFLIARYREELADGLNPPEAVAAALAAVGNALAASALTTISGLSMMFFADFGKFSHSGPVIALCLAVALAACLTLTPAILRGCGRAVFWPGLNVDRPHANPTRWESFWRRFARPIVARPGLILVLCAMFMLPWAGYGYARSDRVTYDVLSLLSESSPSRVGADVLRQHFNVGESGPITLLVWHGKDELDGDSLRDEIATLTKELYLPCRAELLELQQRDPALDAAVQQILQTKRTDLRFKQLQFLARQNAQVSPLLGVVAVRSLSDPLGNYPPGAKIGLFNWKNRSTWSMRSHQIVQQSFVADKLPAASTVARFELLLRADPFSIEALQQLERIEQRVREHVSDTDSYWHNASFAFTGTTAGMSDLRQVTQADNRRIQLLVVIAVSIVLLAILRRPVVCLYMVATVLLSYFVTLGITHWLFATLYGSDFHGLDWKVPVFLFVILVAVGQDYNVYLVSRVLQEQSRYGLFTGLRRAIALTGGIITSCGVIMAGTFISMTSGTWHRVLPWFESLGSAATLRSMVELGFALALGVMIDTFLVRTVLLPTFLAIQYRLLSARRATRDASEDTSVRRPSIL